MLPNTVLEIGEKSSKKIINDSLGSISITNSESVGDVTFNRGIFGHAYTKLPYRSG